MVGHTGSIPAAIKAVETVDECLGRIVEAVHAKGGACLITADHGNADNMLEPDGSPNTAHSLNPVPVIVTAEGARLDGEGILADVAPTLLAMLGDRAARRDDRPLAAAPETLRAQLARRYPLRPWPSTRPLAKELSRPSWAPGAASCGCTRRS